MKTGRYTIAGLLVLILTLVLLFIVDKGGAVRRESRRILLDDSSSIDQLVIAGDVDTVRLSKTGDIWQLPGGEQVNPVSVENLLFAAERLQVDGVLAEQGDWTGKLARQVFYLSENRRVLQYETLWSEGSLLLRLAESERVFRVSLPGYQELDLSQVFSSSAKHYREHILIDLLPSEIRLIELEKRGQPAFRFSMDEAGELHCSLPQTDSLVPAQLLNEEAVRMLFTYFTSIRYEEKAGGLVPARAMEGLEEWWLASLYIESQEGEKHNLKIYSIPVENGEKSHMFRALVKHNNSPDALIVNYIYLDVLMRGLSVYIGDNL